MALLNRPDIKALELTQDKARLDRQLAQNQAWQDVTLTLEVSRQGPDDSSPEGSLPSVPPGYSWDAALNIPFPSF